MPRAGTQSDSPVYVDLETFQSLEPLVRYCRELESDYKAALLDANKPLTKVSFFDLFAGKGEAMHRSLFLIDKIKEMPPEVKTLLDENSAYGRDLGLIAASFDHGDQIGPEILRLGPKYGLGDQPDKKQLVGAILRRLNATFTRIRVVR